MQYIIFNLQIACKNKNNIPKKSLFKLWLNTIFSQFKKTAEITIRIVDKKEIQKLNLLYCKKDKPTNILSFSFNDQFNSQAPTLGDLVICQQLVKQEAQKQQKPLEAHWAHIVTHGCLHLLGYDHVKYNEAYQMQLFEINIMITLGYKDPYSF